MALPLGEAGIRDIPNESAVLGAMQSSMGEKTGIWGLPSSSIADHAAFVSHRARAIRNRLDI